MLSYQKLGYSWNKDSISLLHGLWPNISRYSGLSLLEGKHPIDIKDEFFQTFPQIYMVDLTSTYVYRYTFSML